MKLYSAKEFDIVSKQIIIIIIIIIIIHFSFSAVPDQECKCQLQNYRELITTQITKIHAKTPPKNQQSYGCSNQILLEFL